MNKNKYCSSQPIKKTYCTAGESMEERKLWTWLNENIWIHKKKTRV